MKKSSLNSALLAVVACFSLSAPRAQADIAMTAQEVGPDVMFSYSGAIDLTGLGAGASGGGAQGIVYPVNSFIAFGPSVAVTNVSQSFSSVSTSPANIGPGPGTGPGETALRPTSFKGNYFSIHKVAMSLPQGYGSGSQISGSMTFVGKTIASMGVTRTAEPYVWELNNGQKITLSFLDPTVGTAKLKKDLKKFTAKLKKAKASNQLARIKVFKKKIKALKKQLRALT